MKEIDLTRILNGDIDHINKVDMYEFTDPNVEVEVLPVHVKKMLLLYLNSQISAEQINAWAVFLCHRTGEYICREDNDDEDFYEDMWYVVQKLSTPNLDGEITPGTVRIYLKELDKYFVNESESDNDEF